MSPSKKILFMLSGSISAYKACTVVSRLVQDGHQVQCVMSENASRFVGASTLEGLTGRAVHSDTFEPGHQMDHIYWMNWCDLVIACPATAHLINRFATGNASDLLTNLFLAFDFKKPFLVFPAMNTKMWQHPVTQGSAVKLREIGIRVYDPQPGALACGEVGPGRLWEPDDILNEIHQTIEKASGTSEQSSTGTAQGSSRVNPLRVLITSGGTQEPIDNVRAITNLSTGETGAKIVETLARAGHLVHWLRARSSVTTVDATVQNQIELHVFTSAADLLTQMQNLLGENTYDILIHAAAISDYTVESIQASGVPLSHEMGAKLSSSHENLDLRLKRTPKIIAELGKLIPTTTHVFAFKLTSGADLQQTRSAVDQLFRLPHVQWVIHNDERRFNAGEHWFSIYQRGAIDPLFRVAGKPALAQWFQNLIRDREGVPRTLQETKREIEL